MKLTRVFALVSALALSAVAADAAVYEIDPVHSSITFKVRHLVGRVTGTFDAFGGTIDYDGTRPLQSRIEATIDTASINTRSEKRDEHLRSRDFFDTAVHPNAIFKMETVDLAGKTITGSLTLHGITKPVVMSYEMGGIATGKDGKNRLGGSATAVIKRSDYGINYDPAFVTIGDEVTVELEIEAVESPEATANAERAKLEALAEMTKPKKDRKEVPAL